MAELKSSTMVRYFTNPYPDYSPDTVIKIDEESIIKQTTGYVEQIAKNVNPTHQNVEGGLYVGISGIAYMFYRLSKSPHFKADSRISYIEKATEYITPSLEMAMTTRASEKQSFMLGNAGSFAVAAVIFKPIDKYKSKQALDAFIALHRVFYAMNFLNCGSDELFVGRAGYLAGLLFLNKELGITALPFIDIYRICDVMIESGRLYAQQHFSPTPLMYAYYKTEYFGAAHGVSFILQMLISIPGYLEHNPSAAQDIKTTIDFILSIQSDDGNWPSCMEEITEKEHELVHWCHGAPGVVYLMAKAYLIFKEKKYLEACEKASNLVWTKGLLKKGPGICHGVAGNAFVFLLLYQLTSKEKYLHQAHAFSDFLNAEEFLEEANIPDNPFSLYEGTAGTVCFLADLLEPKQASFPFQDVFTEWTMMI